MWNITTGFSGLSPWDTYSIFMTGRFTRASMRWTNESMKSGSASLSNIDGSD
jgi:hypothetical protein